MSHPAKFHDDLLDAIRQITIPYLAADSLVLDPFSGVGRVHELEYATVGNEIEHDWAHATHPATMQVVGDALKLPFADESFSGVITSPTYGNRMADHHDAKDASKRNTYKHRLGHDLHPANSGQMQWGEAYRTLHVAAWAECYRVLCTDGVIVVNVKDHIRKGEVMPVTDWHAAALKHAGFHWIKGVCVETPGLRHGANHDKRVDHEWLLMLRK